MRVVADFFHRHMGGLIMAGIVVAVVAVAAVSDYFGRPSCDALAAESAVSALTIENMMRTMLAEAGAEEDLPLHPDFWVRSAQDRKAVD